MNLDAVIDNDLFCRGMLPRRLPIVSAAYLLSAQIAALGLASAHSTANLRCWSTKILSEVQTSPFSYVSKHMFPLIYKLTRKQDVLETVAASYRTHSVKNDGKETSISSFYRRLYENRCVLSDDGWIEFRQELSDRISFSCEKLRNEKIAELPALSLAPDHGHTRNVSLARASDSSENSRSPSPSSSVTTASSSTPAEVQRQRSAEPLPAANEAFQIHQASHPAISHGSATTIIPDHRYISYIWEHAQARGLAVNDENTCLETFPKTYLHKVTYDGVSGEGIGRNGKLAKQAAYKQLSQLKGLSLF